MKNCIKKMRLSFIAIAVLMGGWSSYSMADDTHRTGLKETTPQEEAFIKKNWKKIKKVKPNKLGLERINKAKKQKNLPLLDESVLAPMGEDVKSGTEQEPLGETLPSFVDNSTLPAFPAIRSQGSQGSCVAWASTYYQMTHNTGLMRDSNHTEGDMSTIFSPKWTYNLINHGEDNGAYLSDPFILLEKNGASMWSEFPYSDAEYRKWPLVPEVWRNAISHRTDGDGVQYVSDIDYTAGLEQLKAILTNGYVVTFGTWISSWQYKTVSDDNSTTEDNTFVGDNSAYWMNGNVGGHMMTFVGYSDDIWIDINGDGDVDTGEKGALKVANSWGDWWSNGNDGFIWLVTGGPSSSRRDGALMSDRAYHLIVQNNYTPKVLAEVTLNHAKRDQLRVKLGVTDGIQTTLWYPFAMNAIGVLNTGTGGPYAFDAELSFSISPTLSPLMRGHDGMSM
jgi:C1A family cysteine protease